MTKKLPKYCLEFEFFPPCISCLFDKKVLSSAYFLKNSDILNLLNPCNINKNAIFKKMSLGKDLLCSHLGAPLSFPKQSTIKPCPIGHAYFRCTDLPAS